MSSDGCNTCTCTDTLTLACTKKLCPVPTDCTCDKCKLADFAATPCCASLKCAGTTNGCVDPTTMKTVAVGQSFPSSDGCNTV